MSKNYEEIVINIHVGAGHDVCVSAQSLGDVPETVSADDVTILKESVLVFASHDSIVPNAKTGKIDTLNVTDGMKILPPKSMSSWQKTPNSFAPA